MPHIGGCQCCLISHLHAKVSLCVPPTPQLQLTPNLGDLQIDGVLASTIFDDFFEVGEALLKADPGVQALCKEFGIASMDEVAIDPWPSETSRMRSTLPLSDERKARTALCAPPA